MAKINILTNGVSEHIFTSLLFIILGKTAQSVYLEVHVSKVVLCGTNFIIIFGVINHG